MGASTSMGEHRSPLYAPQMSHGPQRT